MNVSESVHVIYKKFYRNRENIHEDMSEYKFLKKKAFFSGFDPTGLSTFKPATLINMIFGGSEYKKAAVI